MKEKRYPGHSRGAVFATHHTGDFQQPLTLAVIRRSLGVSQEEMAKRLGVGQAAVSKIENRDDPQLQSLIRYCEALGGRLELAVTFSSGRLLEPTPEASSSRFPLTLPTEATP